VKLSILDYIKFLEEEHDNILITGNEIIDEKLTEAEKYRKFRITGNNKKAILMKLKLKAGFQIYLGDDPLRLRDYNHRLLRVVATLGPGCSFGELALMNSKPRAATIRTIEDSVFATLDKEDYKKGVGNSV
jgi:CRP-like cAMP-binding protein